MKTKTTSIGNYSGDCVRTLPGDERGCTVCQIMADRPVTLQCGHPFCEGCFHKDLARSGASCPRCRSSSEASGTRAAAVGPAHPAKRQRLSSGGRTNETGHALDDADLERLDQLRGLLRESEKTLQENREEQKRVRSTIASVERTAGDVVTESMRVFGQLEHLVKVRQDAVVSTTNGQLCQLMTEEAEIKRRKLKMQQLLTVTNRIQFLQDWATVTSPLESGASSSLSTDQADPFSDVRDALSTLEEKLRAFGEEHLGDVPPQHELPSGDSPCPVSCSAVPLSPESVRREDLLRYRRSLTLDPNTAHKFLWLSDDEKKVTRGTVDQRHPYHQNRFSHRSQVLCREGLQGDRCYWEVEVLGAKAEISLTYEGIKRTGISNDSSFGGNKISWCLEMDNGKYSVSYGGSSEPLIHSVYRLTIGVFLDFHAGFLSFYAVSPDDVVLLRRFSSAFREPLYAGFWLGQDCSIRLVE
ncbi:tripartite motif-containing protein 16-like protein [Denticeps clupeoides]|uniref:Uncharacterized protein n=1 Tax=Denticeps clupeoides TaxID=299321 RepID=A0AAY4CFT0_9TELE|nr:tripartite motif-containing protein 16-like protein [Denticeps clupeoides]XP_028853389.1 tripartite motif-containing protein 16-like protein [Denticeps clupeoides]